MIEMPVCTTNTCTYYDTDWLHNCRNMRTSIADCEEFIEESAYAGPVAARSPPGLGIADSRLDPKSRYYAAGDIETLDIIKAKLTPEGYRGYLLGNIIKYACRAEHKGKYVRDIEKINFIARELKRVQKEKQK